MKKTIKIITFFVLSLSLNLCFAQVRLDVYALQGVTIIDGVSKKPLINQTIIIQGEKILKIFPTNTIKLADSIVVFNLKGKYVIPGLIDTHVHLASDYASRSKTEKMLGEMLFSGVTSVRDMANDARTLSSIAKDALVGDINSPAIYYSAIMAGPKFFKDERSKGASAGGVAGEMPYMKAITDSTNLVLAVAEAKGTGATGIKLYMLVSGDLAKKVVDEAEKQNMKVWGHATLYPAKPMEVVNAGLSVISHADLLISWDTIPRAWKKREKPEQSKEYWDEEIKKVPLDEVFNLMKEKGTIFDATLSVYYDMLKEKPYSRWKYEIAKRIVEKAYLSGVKISTGTDVDQTFFVQEEMKRMVNECSFKPIDAIISATSIGAEAIGILKTHGTIEAGKYADMVILYTNPLDDIKNIDKVGFVIRSGRIYKK